MQTYAILRRAGWNEVDELGTAVMRGRLEAERTPDDITWIRSYVLAETDGSVGTICLYEATSPEAIRAHASRAGLPLDEIVKVAETIVVRPDSAAEAA